MALDLEHDAFGPFNDVAAAGAPAPEVAARLRPAVGMKQLDDFALTLGTLATLRGAHDAASRSAFARSCARSDRARSSGTLPRPPHHGQAIDRPSTSE